MLSISKSQTGSHFSKILAVQAFPSKLFYPLGGVPSVTCYLRGIKNGEGVLVYFLQG